MFACMFVLRAKGGTSRHRALACQRHLESVAEARKHACTIPKGECTEGCRAPCARVRAWKSLDVCARGCVASTHMLSERTRERLDRQHAPHTMFALVPPSVPTAARGPVEHVQCRAMPQHRHRPCVHVPAPAHPIQRANARARERQRTKERRERNRGRETSSAHHVAPRQTPDKTVGYNVTVPNIRPTVLTLTTFIVITIISSVPFFVFSTTKTHVIVHLYSKVPL